MRRFTSATTTRLVAGLISAPAAALLLAMLAGPVMTAVMAPTAGGPDITGDAAAQPPVNLVSVPAAMTAGPAVAAKPDIEGAARTLGAMPMAFEENRGQHRAPHVVAVARGDGYTVAIERSGSVAFAVRETPRDPATPGAGSPTGATGADARARNAGPLHIVRLDLIGALDTTRPQLNGSLPGRANYLIGNDRAQWHTGIQRFREVRFPQVLDGVDLAYYGLGRRLEYDFIVRAGASPSSIALRVSGVDALTVNTSGDLLLSTPGTDVQLSKPVAYQTIAGQRRDVAARFVLRGSREIGFDVGSYDRSQPLVIDPILSYATYLGGSGEDAVTAVAVGPDGGIYVTGFTSSTDFPTQGAHSTDLAGQDAFVAKLNAAGTALEYATYLGGNSGDAGYGIGVDADGNAYVAGTTYSSDFPLGGPSTGSVFVAKLTAAGSSLSYATRISGSFSNVAVAVSSDGTAALAGTTGSSIWPAFTTQAAFQTTLGSTGNLFDTFVMRLTSAGVIEYATMLGGDGDDVPKDIAIDSSGTAYVIGSTTSTNLATTGTALQTSLAGSALWTSATSGSTWTARPGLAVPAVNAFAKAPGSNTVLAATGAGLRRTTDGGATWIDASLGFQDPYSLAVDANGVTYVGTWDNGLLVGTANGGSWAKPGTLPATGRVSAVAIQPGSTTVAYAAFMNAIYKTSDAGINWAKIDNGSVGCCLVTALTVDPNAVQTLYANLYHSGILKSTDGGVSWTPIKTGFFSLGDTIVVDPGTSPSTLYVASGTTVFKSTDGGGTWSSTQPAGAFGGGSGVLASVAGSPATLYFLLLQDLWVSTDGASTWTRAGSNGTGSLSMTPPAVLVDGSVVYAGYSHRRDFFIAKVGFNGTTSTLDHLTYLGGEGEDADGAAAIAADGMGGLYFGGSQNSTDFPAAGAPLGSLAFGPTSMGVLGRIASDGTLARSTPVTGAPANIVVGPNGDIVTAGGGGPASDPIPGVGGSGWVQKLDSGMSAFRFRAPVPGFAWNSGPLAALAVDSSGDIYLAGQSAQLGCYLSIPPYSQVACFTPTVGALQPTYGGGLSDAYVLKISTRLAIASVLPAAGGTDGGLVVTITGANFVSGMTVTFGGTAATSVSVSDASTLLVTTPAHALGLVDVVVRNAQGESAAKVSAFEYKVAPTVTTVLPVSGPIAGGTVVTITGSGFTGATGVTFGGASATAFTVNSDTSIQATTPARGSAGNVDVGVIGSNGATGVKTNGFAYLLPPPSITGTVYYSTTPQAGIQVDLIQGTNFSGPVVATVTSDGAGHYEFTGLTAGPYFVKLVGPSGYSTGGNIVTVSGATTLDLYLAKLIVLQTPANNSAVTTPHPTLTWTPIAEAARYKVQINETVGWSQFEFQDSVSPSYIVQGTLIEGRSYTWQVGAYDAANHWIATTSTPFRVTYSLLPAPSVMGISPSSGTTSGGTAVTITGTGFTGTNSVTFGGFPALGFTVNSDTSIQATTPYRGSAGAVDVAVTNAVGTGTKTGAFTYTLPAPTISSLNPATGSQAGGTTVSVYGSNFQSGVTVAFGGVPATNIVFLSASQFTAVTPAHAAGAVDVVVTTAGGSATRTNGFTYLPPSTATVTSITPNSGPTSGNAAVTITGTGFVSGATVTIVGRPANAVVVVSDTTITARTGFAPSPGLGDVLVAKPGEAPATLVGAYTYALYPTMTAIAPFYGPAEGGTTITVTGTNLNLDPAPTLTLGGTPATLVGTPTATSAVFTTGAHAEGLVDAVFAIPDGRSVTSVGRFLYGAAPVNGTPGAVDRVSVSTAGAEATTFGSSNIQNSLGSISADGRFATLFSGTLQLVSGMTPSSRSRIFLRDRQLATTIVLPSGGSENMGERISPDGGYIAFACWNFARSHVCYQDLSTSVVTTISRPPGGAAGNNSSGAPDISAGGTHVVFHSSASDLTSPDTNNQQDVFLWKSADGTLANITAAGNGASSSPRISGDGRFVVFVSVASNLVAGDTNGLADLFLYDIAGLTLQRIGMPAGGVQPNGAAYAYSSPVISADGRFVAFASMASNLVAGDTNGMQDTFLLDRNDGSIRRVSVATDGTQASNSSTPSGLCSDGRRVSFVTAASNLVPSDINSAQDVFIHDTLTGVTRLVSTGNDAILLGLGATGGALSADGLLVLLRSTDAHLVAGDTNNAADVFVKALPPIDDAAGPTITQVAPASGTSAGGTGVTISGTGFGTGATVRLGAMAATAVTVVNSTTITATTPAHAAGAVDVVVTNPDMQQGTLTGAFTFTQADATVTLGGLSHIYDGGPRAATATTEPAGLPVTFSYTGLGGTTYGPSAAAPTAAGAYTVTATVTDANYTGSAMGTLTVAKAMPVVTWTNPVAVLVGTALGETQLNASSPSVPGTFVYVPAAGTVLNVGQTLSVTFIPADVVNYATATKTVTIDTFFADPVVTPPGSDVLVVFTDPQTGGQPVTLTFAAVSTPGESSVTTTVAGPAPTPNFSLIGTYYEISTTAVFTGSVDVCVSYPATLPSGYVEAELTLNHFDSGLNAWVPLATTSQDFTNHVICAATTSFSPFAVFGKPNTVELAGHMNGGGSVAQPDGRASFEFDVRHSSRGGRGRVELQFEHAKVRDDDRERGRDQDRDQKRQQKRDRFTSSALTSMTFSDAPGFRPQRRPTPVADTVIFTGTGRWNGRNGYFFEVTATDRGEPGRGLDTFAITIRDGVGVVVASVSGALDRGNIQSLPLKSR